MMTFDLMQWKESRCVNYQARRADGSYCYAEAEDNGWCRKCSAELFPPGRPGSNPQEKA